MLTPKPCKWCGSIWHSKNKCDKRETNPFKPVYSQKGNNVPLAPQNVSERPRLLYKGNGERSQLIGYADKFFSLYIRQRGSDGVTNHCFTCLARLPIEELQCGHFIPRRFTNTRWHKLNCWPQCNQCNVVEGGNLKIYEDLLRAKFGDEAIDALQATAQQSDKFSLERINDVVEQYKGVVF